MKVHKNLAAFLQRVQDLASKGYRWYVQGSFSADQVDKFTAFAERVSATYDIDLTPRQRNYRRSQGVCVVQLMAHYHPGMGAINWVLLATDGEGSFIEREAKAKHDLTNRRQRFIYADIFELVMTTKPAAFGGGHAWTYRMTKEAVESYENALFRQAQWHAPERVDFFKGLLRKLPMFRGVRDDCKRFVTLFKSKWTKAHGDKTPPPVLELPYLRRVKDDLIPLEQLAAVAASPSGVSPAQGGASKKTE